MSSASPALEMVGVERTFDSPAGAVTALRRVDLRVQRGEFVALTGPSGAGKSTCLNLAALLDRPTAGRVLFAGRDVSDLSERELCALRREQVGMVFQQYHLLPYRSAKENVRFGFRYSGTSRAEQDQMTEEALSLLGLTHLADRPARLLSGGEMQRVAIARAIARAPSLLIADEPTGNLDRDSTESVMRCFEKLHGRGHTILLATHNDRLLGYASRQIPCEEGTVVS